MILRKALIAAAALALTAAWTTAGAYELGYPGWAQKPGVTLWGSVTAATPPPGLYMNNVFLTYQATIVGPGAVGLSHAGPPGTNNPPTILHVASEASSLLWVPGWTFLGATYDAVIIQPFIMSDLSAPININPAGMHNTFILPVELGWNLGNSGFFVKTGLGIYVPDGTITGPTGLSGIGNPWWTFEPELLVSYLKDGWNLTANLFEEINTQNTYTGYTSGNILHAEFTATKAIGKWTLGPLAYYAGQVTNDRSSAFYGNAINVSKYDIWAVGALVGYDFGPVALSVWALDEIYNNASSTTNPTGGTIPKGYTVFASISYRLWGPDAPAAPKNPLIHK
jgi:hypothetical protein